MSTNIPFHRELIETFAYQIKPEFAASVRSRILQNRASGISLDLLPVVEERHAFFTRKKGSGGLFSKLVVTDVENQDHDPWLHSIEDTDEAINVIYVSGPIMRNGGGCAIGSIEHRDKLLYCASKPNVLGHIFVLNSPGGSVDAIYDYKEGIEAVKAAGQPCIGIIKGDCDSLCTRVAAQLDEVYYSHDQYRFGSIGTMAITDLMPHGAVNPTTGETHVELYADASTKKNFIFRAASEGNYEPMQEFINKCNEEFLAEMRGRFPNCTEDHLNGDLFTCKEMDGIFLDGKATFEDCISRILALSTPAPGASSSGSTPAPVSGGSPSATQTPNPKQTIMKFELIEAALGFPIEGLTEEGAFMNASLLQSIEDRLAQNKTTLDDLTKAHATEIETLKQSHKTEIDNLNTQMAALNTTIAERDASIAEFNTQVETLNATIAERDATLAERDASIAEFNTQVETLNATIADRDATITELSTAAPQAQNPAPATAQQGEGDGGKQTPTSACASKPGMTIAERREAQRQRDIALGIK